MVRDGRHKSKWLPRTVLERRSVSYRVQIESDLVHHKHVDHLREYMLLQATKTRHNCQCSSQTLHYRRVLKSCSGIHRYWWLTRCLGKHESQAPVAPDPVTNTAEVSSVPVPIHYPQCHQNPVNRFLNYTALPL